MAEEKSLLGKIGFMGIIAIALAIVILLVGGGLAIKLWSVLSSFKGNTLMILLMGIAVLFLYLMFRKPKSSFGR